MKNELAVKVEQKLGAISFNYEEMKENLSIMMDTYKDIEVTEDTSTEAKKDIATLRKIKKALNDRRIKIKKEYMQPYDDFEKKVKELTKLIDEPIELIDKQVKVFEEKQKEEKKQKIKEIYNEIIGDMGEYLPLAKIYDKKWENISTTLKSIREDIEESVSSVEMAVSTIKDMESEVVDEALNIYKQDLSLAKAISYINEHERLKAEILAKEMKKRKEEEERRRKQEEERIREEERRRIQEEERIREEARQEAIEEERKRIAEEEEQKRIAEEERLKALKKEQEELNLDSEPFETIIDGEIIELETDDSFDGEEPFIDEEPFDIEAELPFTTVEGIKSTFIITGLLEELSQVEMYLNSIGLDYERRDS